MDFKHHSIIPLICLGQRLDATGQSPTVKLNFFPKQLVEMSKEKGEHFMQKHICLLDNG